MAKSSNLDDFLGELDREQKRQIQKFVQFHKAVSVYAYKRIIERSPVCSGRYRASHTIAIGAPNEEVAPPAETNECNGQIRAPSIAEAVRTLLGLKPFDIVWINNSLPYASALEYGHSKQAPEGVYEMALQEVEDRYKNVKIFDEDIV